MLSNLLELSGLAALVAGVDYLTNPGWALIAAAPCLLFIGVTADNVKLTRATGVVVRARGVLARRRQRRREARVPTGAA
jgi:hypothetical protein